jgi:hypothetical protein
MVREARALIGAAALSAVRVVQVDFALGWLSGPREHDSKQAAWRTNPVTPAPPSSLPISARIVST